MIRRAYKALGPGTTPCHGGNGAWVPGEWREEAGTDRLRWYLDGCPQQDGGQS